MHACDIHTLCKNRYTCPGDLAHSGRLRTTIPQLADIANTVLCHHLSVGVELLYQERAAIAACVLLGFL